MSPTFTVFTPSYNRARLLPRAYQSLLRQTLQDFEWLIVDDGSTDDTKAVVEQWNDAPFPIRYIYKENGGKHSAMNRAVREARGKYFVILDSDDWLTDDALEKMHAAWQSIPEPERFAEVVGHSCYPDGQLLGVPYPKDPLDSDPAEIQAVYKVWGDKLACHRTAVLREFPFPEDLGRFVTESLVWYRIARRYKSRFVNQVWRVVEYQGDGLTANFTQARRKSAPSSTLFYAEATDLFLERRYPLQALLRSSINYVRFALHNGLSLRQQQAQFPSLPLWLLSLLPGLAFYLADLRQQKPQTKAIERRTVR
jgi:glycosyltransferase involved in cell wall biosynthesis